MKRNFYLFLRLLIPAGKASASPPIGPIFGQYHLNIIDFCKEFNFQTQHLDENLILPVNIFIYNDLSYDYIIKLPSLYNLLKLFFEFEKGSSLPGKDYIFFISSFMLYEIALLKSVQFTYNFQLYTICKVIASSLKSFGVYLIN